MSHVVAENAPARKQAMERAGYYRTLRKVKIDEYCRQSHDLPAGLNSSEQTTDISVIGLASRVRRIGLNNTSLLGTL